MASSWAIQLSNLKSDAGEVIVQTSEKCFWRYPNAYAVADTHDFGKGPVRAVRVCSSDKRVANPIAVFDYADIIKMEFTRT